MLNIKLLTVAFALTSTACAQDVQKEFTGIGNIFVLNSSDWRVADPVADKVGCLDNKGSFISPKSDADCAVFSRLAAYPYTLSTQDGNCTFQDETQERNTDSIYGKQDHSWNCLTPFQSQIYDELYTVTGFSYPFLCSGDVSCYFDTKRIPRAGEKSVVWPFRWGSQQQGITPGHVMLQLLWNRLGDLPKRENEGKPAPGPRVSLEGGLQIPLRGQMIKW